MIFFADNGGEIKKKLHYKKCVKRILLFSHFFINNIHACLFGSFLNNILYVIACIQVSQKFVLYTLLFEDFSCIFFDSCCALWNNTWRNYYIFIQICRMIIIEHIIKSFVVWCSRLNLSNGSKRKTFDIICIRACIILIDFTFLA